jgi:hypothetical protein
MRTTPAIQGRPEKNRSAKLDGFALFQNFLLKILLLGAVRLIYLRRFDNSVKRNLHDYDVGDDGRAEFLPEKLQHLAFMKIKVVLH